MTRETHFSRIPAINGYCYRLSKNGKLEKSSGSDQDDTIEAMYQEYASLVF
jgi:hypothetical protein